MSRAEGLCLGVCTGPCTYLWQQAYGAYLEVRSVQQRPGLNQALLLYMLLKRPVERSQEQCYHVVPFRKGHCGCCNTSCWDVKQQCLQLTWCSNACLQHLHHGISPHTRTPCAAQLITQATRAVLSPHNQPLRHQPTRQSSCHQPKPCCLHAPHCVSSLWKALALPALVPSCTHLKMSVLAKQTSRMQGRLSGRGRALVLVARELNNHKDQLFAYCVAL